MNKYVKRSSAIELADTYTPLPKPEERYEPNCYAWLTAPKVEPLHKENLLPAGDREELLRLWEETGKQVEQYRYPDQDDFCNKERQMGKVLSSGELVSRILKMNKNLVVQDGNVFKQNISFYVVKDKQLQYTNAYCERGFVPEFTIMKEDAAGLPSIYPTWGWRTVLVRLLKFGAISWQQVLDTFGDVKFSDSRGKHWKNQVAGFRT
jgi:hypothetical protein